MDLIEAEDTKKRWQKHTEKLYKKDPPTLVWSAIEGAHLGPQTHNNLM